MSRWRGGEGCGRVYPLTLGSAQMGVYSVSLVGESHYQDAIADLIEGDPVELVHEPDNPHDENAVSARTLDGETIGYVPRDHWLQVLVAIERKPAAAEVQRVTGGTDARPAMGVVLQVRTGTDTDDGGAPVTGSTVAVDPAVAAIGCGQAIQGLGCLLILIVMVAILLPILFG